MRRKFTLEQEAEIVRRYETGESSERIALDILPDGATSGANVRNVLRRLEISRRPAAHELNPVVTDAQRSQVVDLCRSGLTLQQAANAAGISRKTASKTTKAIGLPLPLGTPKRR